MIDQTLAATERHAENAGNAAPGSMKTRLEDHAAAMLADVVKRQAKLSTRAHNISTRLRAVRVARAEGTAEQLDAAIAELRVYVELAE